VSCLCVSTSNLILSYSLFSPTYPSPLHLLSLLDNQSFEVEWLKGRSERINAPITYVDITQPSKIRGSNLEPLISPHFNLFSRDDFEVLMSRLHGIKLYKNNESGKLETRLETGLGVIVEMYENAGLHWMAKPFVWSWSRPIAQKLYAFFAKNRLWMTGRKMEIPLECDGNSCRHLQSK
jgi:hypothetical protein